MPGSTVFIDLETTGLDPDRHHIWEFGGIVRGHRVPAYNGEWHIEIAPHLTKAEPAALRVSRYYERRSVNLRNGRIEAWIHNRPPWPKSVGDEGRPPLGEVKRMALASLLAELLDGAQLAGCNPSFDAEFLKVFLRTHWQAPTWHHHLVDVEALALGYLAGDRTRSDVALPELPCKSDELSRLIGVEPPGPTERHTALGDARWAMAMYDRVLGTAA